MLRYLQAHHVSVLAICIAAFLAAAYLVVTKVLPGQPSK